MSEELPTPRRPPRDTEFTRPSSRPSSRPPQPPGEPDEADSGEPDGGGNGRADGWGRYLPADPYDLSPGPAGPDGPRENGFDGGPSVAAPSTRPDAPPWTDQPQGQSNVSDWRLPAVPSAASVPSKVVPYAEHQAAGPGTVKIGLWGSPASGKTTYLAALPQALSNADGSIGNWTIFPNSDASTELLINWAHQLVSDQAFPAATPLGAWTELEWRFRGDLAGSRYARRGPFWRRPPAASEFDLDLIDVSGEAFGYDPAGKGTAANVVETALDHLARAQGLLFLFDPVTERHERTAAQYVNRTLAMLSRRIMAEGRLIGPYLPHYLAVCITKFDHKDVFQQAREAGLVNYGPDGLPRVLDDQARDLFDVICEGRFWRDQRTDSHGGALFVRNQLRKYFHPDRVRYYAISSIGYKKPPGWDPQSSRPGFQFDPDDFSNVIEQGGRQRIRGPIEPVNVLEPLIDLHMQITGRA